MKKMSVAEAAEHFGVSKEAIHNRVRRGSLESVVENGEKFVLVGETKTKKQTPSTPYSNERYYKFLEEQNARLQSRVETLEGETRSLRDQKEQMLIEEREKIEAIYKEKDEQFKNLLQTLSSQFMLQAPQQEEELVEAEIEEGKKEDTPSEGIISLKKYLKKQNYSQKKRDKLHLKCKKLAKKDERFIQLDKKLYLDFVKFDYSDIF